MDKQKAIEAIDKLFPNKEKLGSVVDTFKAIVDFFEVYEKALNGTKASKEELSNLLLVPLFRMGFFSFWAHHGVQLRPILLQAFNQSALPAWKYFLIEGIPTAITIAMPHQDISFDDYRKRVAQILG